MKHTIIAPEGAYYVSHIEGFTLPNGILQKRTTGCGASHEALTNNDNMVIAVPTVELIKNKVAQHNGLVFGVHGLVSFNDFKAYIKSVDIIKIMVTYDSLTKVMTWLDLMGIHVKDINLVVDEYHKLLTAYSYRDKAINNVLSCFNEFKQCTFISATPIDAEYVPKELANLDVYEIEWKSTARIIPIRIKTNKPFNAVSNIIRKHLLKGYTALTMNGNEVQAKELYIYLNSVTSIKDIVESCGLTNDKIKVICSDTDANRRILETTEISSLLDENKPITFITSKCFEGADIYTDSGLSIVVSNVSKKTTLLDIATDIFQISGRLRSNTNPFKNTLIHIYNTGASEMTKEEWDEEIIKRIEESKLQIESFNGLSSEHKKACLKRFALELEDYYTFYNPICNCLEFNDLKLKNDQFMFKIVNDVYSNGIMIRDAYERSGFDMSNNQVYWKIDSDMIASTTRRRGFQEVCKEYIDSIGSIEQAQYEKEYPLLKEIHQVLGLGALATHKYKEAALRQAVYEASGEVKDVIKTELNKSFKVGDVIASKDVKIRLQGLYDQLKLNKKAKASDLDMFFEIEQKTMWIDGASTKAITIKSQLI